MSSIGLDPVNIWKKSFLAGMVVFFLGQSHAIAQVEGSISLLDAYNLARESDTNLAIARFQVDGASAQRDVARGKFFPQVSLFADLSENKIRYEDGPLDQLPAQEYPGERYGLQLRTPLFNMRSFREYERQGALVDEAQEKLAVAESELLGSVVQAYLLVLLTAETVQRFQAELTALEKQLEEASALYEKSLLPITQVLETQTRVDGLQADLVDAEGQAAIAIEKLAQLIGVRGLKLRSVSEHISLMSNVGDPEQAAELAIRSDPLVAAANESLRAARKGISRERGSWFPEVDFVYTSQYSDVGFDNLTSPPRSSESYSISMRYPLFEGGAGSARLRAAWAEYYAAQQGVEAAKRQASGRAIAAWLNLQTASKRIHAARQAAKTAEVNLEAAQKAVRVGTARVTDVLVALGQNTSAKRDLTEARFRRAIGWLELELAVGADPAMLAPRLSDSLLGM